MIENCASACLFDNVCHGSCFLSLFFLLLCCFLFSFFGCRRYTKFYGTSERAAQDLVHDALTSMYFLVASFLSSFLLYFYVKVSVPNTWT